jgi:hypothetical protein
MMGRRYIHVDFVVKPKGLKYFDEKGVDER